MGAYHPKLTIEEHTARAMLLGRVFWYTSYVYVSYDREDEYDYFLDADTLEPVTPAARTERYVDNYGETRCDKSRESAP